MKLTSDFNLKKFGDRQYHLSLETQAEIKLFDKLDLSDVIKKYNYLDEFDIKIIRGRLRDKAHIDDPEIETKGRTPKQALAFKLYNQIKAFEAKLQQPYQVYRKRQKVLLYLLKRPVWMSLLTASLIWLIPKAWEYGTIPINSAREIQFWMVLVYLYVIVGSVIWLFRIIVDALLPGLKVIIDWFRTHEFNDDIIHPKTHFDGQAFSKQK